MFSVMWSRAVMQFENHSNVHEYLSQVAKQDIVLLNQ